MKPLSIFLVLAALASPAHAGGDAVKGESAFKICKACHEAAAETNKIGPHLKGIVGRAPASVPGFAFSEAIKEFAAANPAWTGELLLQYLENPKKFIPGNKMAFAGVKQEAKRADLLAYLETLK